VRSSARPACSWALSQPEASAATESADSAQDTLDDEGPIVEDIERVEPKDMPAEGGEVPVAAGIMARAVLMGAPIDLDDEAHLGAREVDDEVADDELPTEAKPELRPGERLPQRMLRRSRR
jgi:hypothetical protein